MLFGLNQHGKIGLGYALNDFDDSYSVSDHAGKSNASNNKLRKNHLSVNVMLPTKQIMQSMG